MRWTKGKTERLELAEPGEAGPLGWAGMPAKVIRLLVPQYQEGMANCKAAATALANYCAITPGKRKTQNKFEVVFTTD